MHKRPRISEAEWKIMEVLWRTHPLTSTEVIAALEGEAGWAGNTVRTMLARLVKKGALKHAQEGNAYLYRPAVRREQCVHGEVDSLLQRVFGGAAGSLLVHFVENEKLTPKEVQELRDLLEQKKQSP